jgi:hypothetical protein
MVISLRCAFLLLLIVIFLKHFVLELTICFAPSTFFQNASAGLSFDAACLQIKP